MDGKKVVYYSGFEDEMIPYRLKFNNAKFEDDVLTIEPGKNDYFIINKSERILIFNLEEKDLKVETIDLDYVVN